MDPNDKTGKAPLYIKFGKYMPKDKASAKDKKKKKVTNTSLRDKPRRRL